MTSSKTNHLSINAPKSTTPVKVANITKKENQYYSVEVNTLLRGQISHLLPTITNITTLQKECATVLPQLFLHCHVLYLREEQLLLAAPNAAFASKLKQQLPNLQLALQKNGWQIRTIRIKVQINPVLSAQPIEKQCHFPHSALQAFSVLEKNLTQSKHNDGLLDALRTLLKRHK